MGYTGALVAAGCIVHEMRRIGDYQGEWFAAVTMPDGQVGWLQGYYGSCSGCDAFEAEFGYDLHSAREHGEGTWDAPVTFRDDCEECQQAKARLAEFGRGYFNTFSLTPPEEWKAAEL